MIVFDILLLVVLLIGCLLGYKRGFFGSITKPLKIIASICLTIVISSPIINAWTRPLFTGKVEGWIYNSLSEAFADSSADIAAEKMPTLLKLFAEMMDLEISAGGSELTSEEVLTALAEKMATPIGNLIAVVVTYAALFIILMLLLTVLIALLDVVFTRGVLGKINKVLGLLLGAVIATVAACIVANVIALISAEAASGVITQFFKNINPFAIMMSF